MLQPKTKQAEIYESTGRIQGVTSDGDPGVLFPVFRHPAAPTALLNVNWFRAVGKGAAISEAPEVAATATPNTGTPLTVQFESTATDADSSRLTYRWDFGDGAVPTPRASRARRIGSGKSRQIAVKLDRRVRRNLLDAMRAADMSRVHATLAVGVTSADGASTLRRQVVLTR